MVLGMVSRYLGKLGQVSGTAFHLVAPSTWQLCTTEEMKINRIGDCCGKNDFQHLINAVVDMYAHT